MVASNHFILIKENKEVINWGKGDGGSFGDPFAKNSLEPRYPIIWHFKSEWQFQSIKTKIRFICGVSKKLCWILSCFNEYFFNIFLGDGHLYSMGQNTAGECGTRVIVGQRVDE